MPHYPVSDHYDGHRFFNTASRGITGFWKTLKMMRELRLGNWPRWVENHPALNLHAALADNQVAITFVNHATVLIQLPGLNILTDPVWSKRTSPVQFLGPKRVRNPGIAFNDLPHIDVVLVSHNHYDHMDIGTLRKLQRTFNPQIFCALGDKAILEKHNITGATEMDWWDTLPVKAGTTVTFTPTQHFSSRGLFDRNKTLWGGFMINHNNKNIYFGGDAGYSAHYTETQQRLGATDIALLPIGAYEPNWFMRYVHMNPAEAVQAHLDLGAKHSIGIHFNTFQLTPEPIDEPAAKLQAAIAQRGLPADTFITLPEGVTRIYSL